MAALTADRIQNTLRGTMKKFTFPLLAGVTVFQNGVAAVDSASFGFVTKPAAGVNTQFGIGIFLSGAVAGASSVPAQVELWDEIGVMFLDSVTGGGAVTIANLFQPVYWASDHEVTATAGANSIAGRVVQVGPSGYPGAIGICRYSANSLI